MKLKLYAILIFCVTSFFLVNRAPAQMKQETIDQIKLLLQEKESRTPTQQKIGSQLLQAAREQRGEKMVAGINLEKANVRATNAGMVKVDMDAEVTEALLSKITALGGEILYPSKEYHAIRAMVPLSKVETIAGYSEVKFIQPAILSRTVGIPNKTLRKGDAMPITIKKNATSIVMKRRTMPERIARVKKQIEKYMMVLGAGIANSQGDRSHRADDARNTFGYSGEGIKIGVLSDSYNHLVGAAADVLSGDLPGVGNPFGNTTPVTVLQDDNTSTDEDEGRAMLQIVHDLAPKAQLFFATGNASEAGFAANIKALRVAGCDIVIDDLGYYDEPVFQDGTVAQAVKFVTDGGGMYFSSAGNEGALALGTSGVWEGDFTDLGSAAINGITGISKTGTIHNFGTVGSPRIGDSVLTVASGAYNLQWADPWGASANDYDLFMISASGAVKASSTNTQTGTQNPYESFSPPALVAGDRLVVFKAASAAVRAISVNTNRGTLKVATSGQTHGHSAIIDAFCVAAIPATGVPFVATDRVESFTSDGPRRMFYNIDGTPMVAGSKFTFADGKFNTRLKPDITAADGVATTLPGSTGLNPFFGTSAAAPHAGAIAALLKSANTSLTPAQIRTFLINNALDIEAPGYDSVAGYGVLQAYQSMAAVNPTAKANVRLNATTFTEGTYSNSNGFIDPGEIGNLTVQLGNVSSVTATNVTGIVTTSTPGVTIANGTFNFGNLASGATITNTGSPFTFGVNSTVACGTVITFRLLVTFGGGASPSVGYTFTVLVGQLNNFTNISAAIGTPATGGNYTSSTGQQTGRLVRGTAASTCAVPVANPGLTITTGKRQYDAYVFTNTTGISQCFTATLTSANGTNIYTAAYTAAGFVPATPNTNYLAEPGQSANTMQYSFTVAAGAKFTVVVHSVDSVNNTTTTGNEIGTPYTLGITYVVCTASQSCTPVAITTATLPAGAVGTRYIQHIIATGGSGTYVDSLTGNLPAGITFAGDSLSGTPTQAGTFQVSVKVTDPAGCPNATMAYTLVIAGIAPASITATAGTPQSIVISTAATTAFQATVKDASNNPLSGVSVTFTAPTTGATGTFAGGVSSVTVVTNASGIATAPTFTANGTTGSYTVTASVNGVTPSASFIITNICLPTIVTSSADDGPGSLRFIIANSCPNPVITFDPSVTQVNLTSGEIAITRAMTITGNGANVTAISGGNVSRIFNIAAGRNVVVTISGLTFKNGKPPATASNAGGGAIYIGTGTITMTSCVLSNNDCTLIPTFSDGGAISNYSTNVVTLDRCSIINNVAERLGGGIAQWGTGRLTITNSTIAGNVANGAISGAGVGGGLFFNTNTTITNCTIYGNTGYFVGGNIENNTLSNTLLTMSNSIVAGGALTAPGTDATYGYDVDGGFTSTIGYNLIQNTVTVTTVGTVTGNIYNVSPKLLPLANYGGPVPTLLPMSSSVTVNAGTPSITTGTDQRGLPRYIGGRADIGSVETNYAVTLTGGTPQSTLINTAFPAQLQATVTESGNNIAGDSVTFTAPATGASATFPGGTRIGGVVTNVSGVAAITATANNTVGTYNVVGSAGSAFTALTYVLTNSFIPVAFTGCPNVNLIIARPGYNIYNGEGVMMYNMDTTTGAATLIPSGPLKDSLTGRNIDVNGASVNGQDGFVYAIRDTVNNTGTTAAALLYRIGSNYANTVLGNLPTPTYSNPDNLSVVIPSAGSFDDQGNYYYVAMSGAYSFSNNTSTFAPSNYYIGKVANVAALAKGTGTLTATFTKVDFSSAPNDFKTNIQRTVTSTSGSGAGSAFQDIAYSNLFRGLYVYSAYSTGAAYSGQLYSVSPTTGAATFYANPPAFGATNNEVAGISATASGNLRVFMTSGDIYKPVMAQSGDFTSTLVKIGSSGVTPAGVMGSIRGDLASCGFGSSNLPATRVIVPPSITMGLPNQIVAYPNPAQGLTTIAVGQSLNNATVRLLGSAGNIISEMSGVSGYTFQIDMTGKAGGMYTVQVIQGGNVQVAKVVKP